MKGKKRCWLLVGVVALLFSFVCGLSLAGQETSAESDKRGGIRVATQEDWAESEENGGVTFTFDGATLLQNEYLAIDLRVEESYLNDAENMFTPKLKINGTDISDGGGTSFRFYNRNGNPYTVEYKFGGYLFFPKDANGIIYIPATALVAGEETVSSVFSVGFEFYNHQRTFAVTFYSVFKTDAFAGQPSAENTLFDCSAVGADTFGQVTDSAVRAKQLSLTAPPADCPGYATYERKIFTVETPVDSFQNTYFTANFAETEFVSGEYLAIDLKVEEATISGGASSNYAFQIKLNGKTMQQPAGVYKQTFGQEFGVYQRGGSGTGYFGNGVWFFMNVDLDAILYIPSEKLLAGTSSSDAELQDKIKSVTIDYANGNAGRQTKVAYYGIYKASAVGETMNEENRLYNFSEAETDGEGTVTDASLTVSRLTAKIREETDSRFAADMKYDDNYDTVYAHIGDESEYTLRLTANDAAFNKNSTLRIPFRISCLSAEKGTMQIAMKLRGEDSIYSLLDDAEIPLMTVDGASVCRVRNGEITFAEGDEGAIYLPLRYLTKNGSHSLSVAAAEKAAGGATIEYLDVVYKGGDLALGDAEIVCESGGKRSYAPLGKEFSVTDGTADFIFSHYDAVELYVNGEKAKAEGGQNEIYVYGSRFAVVNRLDFFAAAALEITLREGVRIISVQSDIAGEEGKYLTEWIETGEETEKTKRIRARSFACDLPLEERTVIISVTVAGNRSYLVPPETTLKNTADKSGFSFSVKTEYGAEDNVEIEWKVNGETFAETADILFVPESEGQYVVALYVNGAFIDARTVVLTAEKTDKTANGQIVGGKEVTEETGGFFVSTPENWSSVNSYFKVDFPETEIAGKYLAVDFKVEGMLYGASILSSQHQYTVKFGINGSVFSQRNASVIQKLSAVNRTGKPVEVDFKFGNWLFVPENFDGVLFIAAEDLLNAEGVQESVRSFTVDYTGGNTGKYSTIRYRRLYLADGIGDGADGENLLIDFETLQADGNGSVIDARFTCSGALSVKNTTKERTLYTADIIELNDSFEGALKLGIKSEETGGTPVSEPYAFGWAEARVDPFVLKDGFAVQVFAPEGNCYFKIVLEDENGKFWKTDISALPEKINPDLFTLTYLETKTSVAGGYGCFYLPSNTIGTLYVPAYKLVPLTDGSEFKGEDKTAGTEIGRIVKIHFGMDMNDGLGRTLSIGTFANADIENSRLEYVFGTSFMQETQLNIALPDAGTTFKSDCTESHTKNWIWGRLTDRELPGYVNKDALQALLAFCGGLCKDDYSNESWAKFYGKLAVARTMMESSFATQEDVNEAVSALSMAKFNLLSVDLAQEQNSSGGNGKGCGAQTYADGAALGILLCCGAAVAVVLKKKGGGKR